MGGRATLEPTAQRLWVRGCWSRGPLYVDTPAGPLGPVLAGEGGPAPGLPELSLPLAHTPPPTPLCLPPEVGVCSFARFSEEFLQLGPSAPDVALAEVAADGPEVPLQDTGQTVCFSALGMLQCCKVGGRGGCWCCTGGWRRWGGRKRREGPEVLASARKTLGCGVRQDGRGRRRAPCAPVRLPIPHDVEAEP